ncbi:MAG TPA: gamma-glutamyl-gamma-aminobutyrate hydrolase family protein [Gemmatimonadaceae bacterium]|nr:gamma-glutamyl-gamma-aminobutyrate hydrolase family protein [Acidimicrobiia bacterium]
MPFAPFVIVTATTEIIRDVSRVRVNEAYTDALTAAGLVPVVLPPMDPSLASAALNVVAGLVLTGGEDMDPRLFGEEPHPAAGQPHAARDLYELSLARTASSLRIPTLAICRGMQVMNVALGGTLIQDIPSERPSAVDHNPTGKRADRVHRVDVDPSSRLARVLCSTLIFTNSSHHQAVHEIGGDLRATAHSEDGIVEGIESIDPAWWMVGVQWHPEELTATAEDWDRRLFGGFADAVRDSGRD